MAADDDPIPHGLNTSIAIGTSNRVLCGSKDERNVGIVFFLVVSIWGEDSGFIDNHILS